MRKVVRFKLIWLLAAATLLLAVSCGAESDVPDPTQPEVAVESVEAAYIVGRWEVNDGRFGHKIFDFQEDGRLLLEDVDSAETIEMTYTFVGENSLVLSGHDEFNGSATANFYEDKMDLTVNFDGTIYGELYEFTRVPDTN
ncbi:MAG: hypothetical protein IPM53_04715 [Anaerolineaceae bacterium]|nr:hypothetical protein [Anaerolineaceae bacterium]